MATGNGNVEMMVSVLPGTMTGFASLNAGLASINNSFLNMTQAISDNFGMVDAAILSTGVVIAQVASNAVNAFADFEQSMKIVQLVSGQTAQEISYLGQKANEFAVQYRTDIDQITEGMQTLGRAGLNSATEQTEVLENGLSTAKLEGRELNSVLEELIQNTALLGGNLKENTFGEDSSYVNNLMVATSLSAPIDTHDISETLKYSGGIAAAAGAHIRDEEGNVDEEGKEILTDYMASIAAFAQKGVKGSIAGTALRAFFNKPATQDSSVVEALASIHLKPEYLWEDDEQTMKPISEQIGIIQKAMDKMNVSTMDRLQLWSKIVGGKMGQQMMKLDSNDIKEINHDIKEAESANSLATKSMQTFKSAMNEVGQEGQRAFRNFGSTLVFVLNPVLQVLKQIVHLFNNPIATSALAVGLFAFFRAFISRVRQVIGGFTQGLRNIWNDYTNDNRHSIKFYHGDVDKDGNKIYPWGVRSDTDTKSSSSSDKTVIASSLKDFRKQWQQGTSLWSEYQKGKITANQLGALDRFSNFTDSEKGSGLIRGAGKGSDKGDLFPKFKGASDRRIMEQLIRANYLRPYHYDALQSGMSGTAFIKKYQNDLRILYAQYLSNDGAVQASIGSLTHLTMSIEKLTAASEAGALALQQQQALKRSQEEAANRSSASRQHKRETARSLMEKDAQKQHEATQKQHEANQTALSKEEKIEEARLKALEKRQIKQNAGQMYTEPIGPKRNIFSDLKNKVFVPSENVGQNALITSQDEIEKSKRNREDVIGKHMITERNKKNAGESSSGTITQSQPSLTLNAAMKQAADEAQRILALKEQELMVERQIADEKAARAAKDESNRQALADARKTHAYNDPEGKKQFDQDLKNRRDTINYVNSSAKKNASAAFEKGASDFVETSKKAAEKQMLINKSTDKQPKPTRDFSNMSYMEARKAFFGGKGSGGTNPLDYNQGAGSSFYALTPTQQRGDFGQDVGFRQNFRQQISGKVDKLTSKVGDIGSTFRSQFAGFLTKDRSGSAFAFANKGAGKFGNALLNLTDLVGGPVMAAFMLIPIIIQQIQNWQQSHVKKLQELSEKVDDAYEKINAAESGLRTAYQDEYPDMAADEINEAIYDIYNQIDEDMVNAINNGMDNWIEKMAPDGVSLPEYEENEEGDLQEKEKEPQTFTEAVNENTKALYQAIFELQQATSKYVTEATDKYWGLDGYFTTVSDSYGKFMDVITNPFSLGSQFEDNNEFLLTASQKADDYGGYTELAGLMLEDFKDANGDWIAGLRRLMGQNVNELAAVLPQSTKNYLSEQAQFSSQIGAANNARLQSSMKRDKKTWQSLAKEIAKEERKTGKALDKKSGANSGNKKLEGLVSKLNASMGNNFSRTQILQAAYIQQLQDMYQVAQQVFTPLLQQAATATTNTWQTDLGINSAAQNTVGTTGSTMENAAIIAGLVAIIARTQAKQAFYDAYTGMDPKAPNATAEDKYLHEKALNSKDANEFYREVMKDYDRGTVSSNFFGTDIGKFFSQGVFGKLGVGGDVNLDSKYGAFQYGAFTESIAKQVAYGYNPTDAWKKAQQDANTYRKEGRSIQDYLTDIDKNYQNPEFLGKVAAAYEASGIGDDDDSGSGGGGGSGGGDSDDKDKGTKKERVDLVLCNKKEIPKLNVNLFKKPPSFTVLNKNFKLRDIKVNTQDKPKAVLSSIKNAIIDVQKRSDPKIIQDESAEYDPAGATDGTNVPSGSTNTSTD